MLQNEEMANVVCRSLGFAGGSIYTFGATRLLPTLPIVAGFKTCAGTESNIFQCGSPGTMTDVGGGAAGFSNGADDPDCWIGCRGADGQPCPVSFYSSMYTRDGDWGPAAPMRLRDDFVWETDVAVADGAAQVWLLALADDGSKKFGSMMDLEVQRATEAQAVPGGALLRSSQQQRLLEY